MSGLWRKLGRGMHGADLQAQIDMHVLQIAMTNYGSLRSVQQLYWNNIILQLCATEPAPVMCDKIVVS